jgi:hypothetical protein
MNVSREQIFDALLSQLNTATLDGTTAFVTASRKFQQWDQVDSANRPALFVVKGFEHASQNTYGETKWRIKAVAWIVCDHSADSDTPGALLNNLLDAVEAALAPTDGLNQTLGDLVTNAFIDGEVVVSEGSLPDDTTSIAVLPITIETGV